MRRQGAIMKCILAWLCVLMVLAGGRIPAKAENAETDKFVQPTLPPDVNPYDPEHPDELSEDQIIATSAILIEESTGEVIFSKNPDKQMYPASTTKILTTLLGLTIGKENGLLDSTVTISDEDVNLPEGSSLIPLKAGETVNFTDLMYATMIRSGNEGANAIAEAVSGSIPSFVDLMNQAAQSMGCTATHFANPHGLQDENHYTTARDMAIIAREAMKNSTFREIVASTSYAMPRSNMQKAWTVNNNTNLLLLQKEGNAYYYQYANGIKTGFHNQAGYCYVGSATKEGVSLISVVLFTSDKGRWSDTKKLMEYGFSQYVSVSPVDLYQINPIVLETTGFSAADPDMGKLPLTLTPLDTSATATIVATKSQVNAMARNLQQLVNIEYIRDFAAPIDAGEQMGTLTYFPTDGGDPVEYALVASRAVAARENAPKSIQQIQDETLADRNPFPRFSLEYLLMAAIPFSVLYFALRILRRLFRVMPGRDDDLPKRTTRRYR